MRPFWVALLFRLCHPNFNRRKDMLYEVIVSSFMLILGIAGTLYTQSFRKPNAKWMPLIAFGIMIVFSLVVLIHSLVKYFKNRGKEKEEAPVSANQEGEGSVSWLDAHEGLVSAIKIAIILLFFVSFKLINFFISMPIVICAVGFLSGLSWKKVIPTAAVATAVVYGVFIAWLHVYIG